MWPRDRKRDGPDSVDKIRRERKEQNRSADGPDASVTAPSGSVPGEGLTSEETCEPHGDNTLCFCGHGSGRGSQSQMAASKWTVERIRTILVATTVRPTSSRPMRTCGGSLARTNFTGTTRVRKTPESQATSIKGRCCGRVEAPEEGILSLGYATAPCASALAGEPITHAS